MSDPTPNAESLRFVKVAEVDGGEFWYYDDKAWWSFIRRIDAAISEHDPWFLLGTRPDGDEFVVDVLDHWAETVRRRNIRHVSLYRKAQIDGSGAPREEVPGG